MIKPGSRWKSQVCSAEVIVVRPPAGDGTLQCGGVDMIPQGEEPTQSAMVAGHDAGCLMGKRYRLESPALEVLCTRPGQGSLGFCGSLLTLAEAKQLPSSD
ncbi:MAG: hypothetical protein WCY11_09615 [Novosphingobium sp.]